jgi:hypothetical protein
MLECCSCFLQACFDRPFTYRFKEDEDPENIVPEKWTAMKFLFGMISTLLIAYNNVRSIQSCPC